MSSQISTSSGVFVTQYLSELEKILARNTRSQADEFAQGLRLVDAIREELGIEEKEVKTWTYYENVYRVYEEICHDDAVKEILETSSNVSPAYVENTASVLANELFEATANAEQVAGYYLAHHGDSAYEDWLQNTKGKDLNEQDKEVERILEAYPVLHGLKTAVPV